MPTANRTNINATADQGRNGRHMPGEVGIWVFIFGDLLVFTTFFLIFMYYRGAEGAVFSESREHMNQLYAVINTALMLTSSWFVAMGVQDVREDLRDRAARMFNLAFLCGAGFAVVKYFEYSEKLGAGITFHTNDFFSCYYVFTVTHLMHVLMGMLMLKLMIRKQNSSSTRFQKIRFVEAGASFWHLVDLLWIVLFALFYLLK